jgi:hypothetical protein
MPGTVRLLTQATISQAHRVTTSVQACDLAAPPPLAAVCRWDDGQATVNVSGEVDFATAGILARCPDEVTRRAHPGGW